MVRSVLKREGFRFRRGRIECSRGRRHAPLLACCPRLWARIHAHDTRCTRISTRFHAGRMVPSALHHCCRRYSEGAPERGFYPRCTELNQSIRAITERTLPHERHDIPSADITCQQHRAITGQTRIPKFPVEPRWCSPRASIQASTRILSNLSGCPVRALGRIHADLDGSADAL